MGIYIGAEWGLSGELIHECRQQRRQRGRCLLWRKRARAALMTCNDDATVVRPNLAERRNDRKRRYAFLIGLWRMFTWFGAFVARWWSLVEVGVWTKTPSHSQRRRGPVIRGELYVTRDESVFGHSQVVRNIPLCAPPSWTDS